eukprot:CCRYP_008175-RB/>CCRYP_008175-RB protein AED:0.48 eAED:0.48 QI:0/-1/0/1/-1/0/1/0/24
MPNPRIQSTAAPSALPRPLFIDRH